MRHAAEQQPLSTLRMNGALPLLPFWAFMTRYKLNFTFALHIQMFAQQTPFLFSI
jgi:hypothetical protein